VVVVVLVVIGHDLVFLFHFFVFTVGIV
jgi:hypothetical protein